MKHSLKIGLKLSCFASLLILTSACVRISEDLSYRLNLQRFSSCGDFLARWGSKPPTLQFSGCERRENPQYDRLVASYSVPGQDAAAIETFLKQKFQMPALKFRCCGWEPVRLDSDGPSAGRYIDRFGNRFKIVMYSEETVENERQDWSKISQFKVQIIHALGTP